jgi:hypothetical protein
MISTSGLEVVTKVEVERARGRGEETYPWQWWRGEKPHLPIDPSYGMAPNRHIL